jgi:hypothetical protein
VKTLPRLEVRPQTSIGITDLPKNSQEKRPRRAPTLISLRDELDDADGTTPETANTIVLYTIRLAAVRFELVLLKLGRFGLLAAR